MYDNANSTSIFCWVKKRKEQKSSLEVSSETRVLHTSPLRNTCYNGQGFLCCHHAESMSSFAPDLDVLRMLCIAKRVPLVVTHNCLLMQVQYTECLRAGC